MKTIISLTEENIDKYDLVELLETPKEELILTRDTNLAAGHIVYVTLDAQLAWMKVSA